MSDWDDDERLEGEIPDPDETVEYVIQIDKWFFGDNEEYRITLSYTDDDKEITSADGDTVAEAFSKIVGDLKI